MRAAGCISPATIALGFGFANAWLRPAPRTARHRFPNQSVPEAGRADVVRLPIAAIEGRDGAPGALVAGVNELAAADVDPVVAQPRRVGVGEEDRVTRLERVHRD